MLRLTLGAMRAAPSRLAGALVAVVLAVALIAAATSLLFAAGNAAVTSDRYAAAAVVVQFNPSHPLHDVNGDPAGEVSLDVTPRIPAALAGQVAAIPGVTAAVPDLWFYAQAVDRDGNPLFGQDGADPYGHPWPSAVLTPFTLQSGTAPSAPNEIVLDADLAARGGFQVGDTVTILSSELPTPYRLVGIVAPPGGNSLPKEASLFFTSETAARLANSGNTSDAIGVVAAPGTDTGNLVKQIRATLHDDTLRVLTTNSLGKADPTSDAQAFTDVASVLGVMGGLAGFVAMFVIASTFGFSVLQRTREIGLLRATGATPRQIMRMIAGEALILGLVGVILGCLAGIGLAKILVELFARYDLGPESLEPDTRWWVFSIPAGVGIGVTLLAVFGAARRASRIRPIEALREAAVQRKLIGRGRLFWGVLFLAGTIAMAIVVPGVESEAQIALALGLAMLGMITAAALGPVVAAPFCWLLGKVVARFGGISGDLARWNTRRGLNRVASVASPLMLAVGFGCLMFFLTATIRQATVDQTEARTTVDYVVSAEGPGLPQSIVTDIAAVPGVSAATGTMETSVAGVRGSGEDRTVETVASLGVDGPQVAQMLELDVQSGSLADLQGNTVALSRMQAEMWHADVGEDLHGRLEDWTDLTLRVVAIYDNALGFADLLIPLPLAADHTNAALLQQVYVQLALGADRDTVRDGLATLAQRQPTMEIPSRAEYLDAVDAAAVDSAWGTYLIVGVSVFFAALAVVNTLIMSTSERVRKFSLLRLIGFTPRDVLKMVVAEAVIVAGIGIVVGGAVAGLSMVPISLALTQDAGSVAVPPLETAGVVLTALAVALTASYLPAILALRANPVENIGLRE